MNIVSRRPLEAAEIEKQRWFQVRQTGSDRQFHHPPRSRTPMAVAGLSTCVLRIIGRPLLAPNRWERPHRVLSQSTLHARSPNLLVRLAMSSILKGLLASN